MPQALHFHQTNRLVAPDWIARRSELREDPAYEFADPEEYCKLLVCNRKLERADIPRAGLRGLCDVETGRRFVIEVEKLFEAGY